MDSLEEDSANHQNAFTSTTTDFDKELCETKFFRIPKFCFRFLGMWPEDQLSSAKVWPRIVVNLIILSLAVVSEFLFSYLNLDDLPLVLDALCPSSTKLVTIIKFLVLLKTRKQVTAVLTNLRQLWFNEKRPECMEINVRVSRYAHYYAIMLFAFSNGACVTYFARPIISIIQDYVSDRNITKSFPFKSVYPYDEFVSPVYEITYFFISYSGTITVFGLISIDGMFIAFFLHISAQFDIIQYEIKNIMPTINGNYRKLDKLSRRENEQLTRKLAYIVKKHLIAIDMCENLVKLFIPNILIHFLSAAFVICISSIDLILAKGVLAFLYLNYSLAALTQLFVYCAAGTYIIESSSKICECIYFIEWYKADVKNQKMIMLIMLRSQRSTGIFVPFFQASLQTFSTILSTAGSYIALLKTFL